LLIVPALITIHIKLSKC